MCCTVPFVLWADELAKKARLSDCLWSHELFWLDPKPSDLPFGRLKRFYVEGRTRACSSMLRRLVGRGERLIELGDSWFSAKSIEVEQLKVLAVGVELLFIGGLYFGTG